MAPSTRQHFFAVRDYDLRATLSCGQAFRWTERDGACETETANDCARRAAVNPGVAASRRNAANPASGEWRRTATPLRREGSSEVSQAPKPRMGATNLTMQNFVAPATQFCIGQNSGSWEGVVGPHWVRLRQSPDGLHAETVRPLADWQWLTHYLQTEVNLSAVLASFPDDEPMRAAVAACRGLRILRQDPWECVASFILSSTKQIVQIQQIIGTLCRCFGEPVEVPPGYAPEFSFPTAARLATCSEADLRACKMGFRAPHLLQAARSVAGGTVDLDSLRSLPLDEARLTLLRLRGVGEKIANCVLLFALGFPTAFPVDVWVARALRQLYFPGRRPSPRRLREFAATHFGPHAGYAQQYLFHYVRLMAKR